MSESLTDSEIHVLLVDDSETDAAVVGRALAAFLPKLKLDMVHSLDEAIGYLGESTPDLAIIDYNLPDGEGISLLRGEEELPFPAIVVTGQSDEQKAVAALKAGALDYVVKSSEGIAHLPSSVERVLREWNHIVERKKAEEAMVAAHRQILGIVDFLPDPTFVVDTEKKVIAWNRAIEDLTGVSKEKVLGKGRETYSKAFYGYDRPILIDLLDDPDPEFEGTYDMIERRGDGYICAEGFAPFQSEARSTCIWGAASALLDQKGNRIGSIESFRDTTSRREAKKKLEAANRELEAFAYTVSHDLRTPLTPIIGYADYLRESCSDRLTEEELNCLSKISSSGERMLALMEDLLTFARVGHVELPQEPLDAVEVVNEVLRELRPQIIHGDIRVEVGAIPPLLIPKTQLTQIFENLIGNAVRYGCDGGGLIEVGGERRGEMIRLAVRDYGPGISEGERERIFEVFYRGLSGKKIGGTGVGLATVQKIAGLFDGRAWVEETEAGEGGSTFWVEMADGLCSFPDGNVLKK